MAQRHYLAPIILSFLFGKMGKLKIPTSWGCFEVWMMNMTVHRTGLALEPKSGRLWFCDIIEWVELTYTKPLSCCVQSSPFFAFVAGFLDPLIYFQRAPSACLPVWPGPRTLPGIELLLRTCLLNEHWGSLWVWGCRKQGASRVFEPPSKEATWSVENLGPWVLKLCHILLLTCSIMLIRLLLSLPLFLQP